MGLLSPLLSGSSGTSSDALTITSPRSLRRWWDALATANASPAVASFHGDSIALGGYAGGTTAGAFRLNGFVSQFRQRAEAVYGQTAGGIIKVQAEYDEVTLTGGSTSGTTGPMQQGYQIPAGATITVAPVRRCTGFTVAFWSGGGAFSWAVDGGAATTITPAGGDTIQTTTISGLTDATHSLVLTGVGTAHVSWVRPTYAATGVVVDRLARSGATANHLAYQTTASANRTRVFDASFKATGADLNVIQVGPNDISAGAPTAADFKTLLQAAADYIATTAGGCTLLVAGPRFAGDQTTANTYYDGMRQIAEATDHVAFVDLMEAWTSFETVNQADLDFMYDTIHPNALGHASLGRLLVNTLLTPQPVA